MAESMLTRMYIEFTERGFATVADVIKQIKERMDQSESSAKLLKNALESGAYAKVANQFMAINTQMDKLNQQSHRLDLEAKFGKIGGAMMSIQERIAPVFNGMAVGATKAALVIGGAATAAFALLTGSIMGFVRAGLAGTVEGARLQFQFQMLSREIAGIFLPIISKVTEVVQRITGWFSRLTSQQQNMIMVVAVVTAGFLAGAAAGAALAASMVGLAAALAAVNVFLGGIPAAIGVVVTVLTALAGGVAAAGGALALFGAQAGAFSKLGEVFQKIWDAVKPLISATMSYWRILSSILEIGMKLYSALVSPFEKLFKSITGGKGILDVLADALDRIANFMDGYVVPAFEALADIISSKINATIDMMIRQFDRVMSKLGNLKAALLSVIPEAWLARLQAFFGMFQATVDKGGHRRPTRMDSGTESAQQTYQRFQTAAFRSAGKTPEQETADHTRKVADWTDAWNNSFANFEAFIKRLPYEIGVAVMKHVFQVPSRLIPGQGN